jgi:hypothetical protein
MKSFFIVSIVVLVLTAFSFTSELTMTINHSYSIDSLGACQGVAGCFCTAIGKWV